MKRSEMLTKLKEIISYEIAPAYATDFIVDKVLKAVEEAGMTPPDCNFYNEEYGVWAHWEEEERCQIK